PAAAPLQPGRKNLSPTGPVRGKRPSSAAAYASPPAARHAGPGNHLHPPHALGCLRPPLQFRPFAAAHLLRAWDRPVPSVADRPNSKPPATRAESGFRHVIDRVSANRDVHLAG